MNDYITTNKAAEILHLTPRRVRQLITAGKLDATRFGRDWQVDRQSVERYSQINSKKRAANYPQ